MVYATRPIKGILGEFTVGENPERKSPDEVWSKVGKPEYGVTPESRQYIEKGRYAIAIPVKDPKCYAKPVRLDEIREISGEKLVLQDPRRVKPGEKLYDAIMEARSKGYVESERLAEAEDRATTTRFVDALDLLLEHAALQILWFIENSADYNECMREFTAKILKCMQDLSHQQYYYLDCLEKKAFMAHYRRTTNKARNCYREALGGSRRARIIRSNIPAHEEPNTRRRARGHQFREICRRATECFKP